jgi:hypothetical protein
MPGGLTVMPTEIQFLKYRLEVVASWPDSGRKRAALEAISSRLKCLQALK